MGGAISRVRSRGTSKHMKIDLFALGVVATAFVLHPTAFEQDTDARSTKPRL